MSKNLTRKGLAFGALVALSSTAVAGTPAFAGETLTLAPNSGTTYNVLTTSDFALDSGYVGTESIGTAALLKYRVTNPTGATMTFDLIEAGVDTPTITDTPYDAAVTNAAATAADVVVYSSDDDPELGARNGIIVSIGEHDKNRTLTVQSWIDLDGNNKINGNEAYSPVRTVSFLDQANVTGSAVLTAPTLGAASLTASVTLSGDVNYQQLDADDISVKFTADTVAINSFGVPQKTGPTAASVGDTVAVVAAAITGSSNTTTANPTRAAWNATDAALKATFTPADTTQEAIGSAYALNALAVASGKVYAATLMVYDGTTYVATGDANAGSTSAGEVATVGDASLAKQANYATTANKIRAGSGTLTVTSTITAVSGKSLAGQTVSFKVEEDSANSLDSGASVAFGGKTLTNSNSGTVQDASVDVKTDALGKATLVLTYSGVKNANAIKVTPSAKGAAATITGTAKVLTAADSLAKALVDTAAINSGTATRAVAKGGAINIAYTAVDQFGQTPVGDYQVVITENASGDGSANFTTNLPVSAGKATLAIADNSTAAIDYTITATLQVKNTDGNFVAISTPVSTTSSIKIGTASTPAAISATVSDDGVATAVARSLNTYVPGNTSVQQESVARTVVDVTNLTGSVTSANGGLIAGVPVTFTLAGAHFKAGTTYANDSITVLTDASGSYGTVQVYSHKAGKQTVSITAGSIVKTAAITFAKATAIQGATMTVTGPATLKAGRTLKVSALLVDEYGNVVDSNQGSTVGTNLSNVKVVYDGPGFTTTTLPTETDADGAIAFNVVVGSADAGVAKITVTYGGENGTIGETTDNDDVVVTKTVLVGISASVSAGSKKANVVVKNASGATVKVVSGTKSTTKVATSDDYKLSLSKLTSGSKTVKVYVNDILVSSKKVTVRR